MNATEQVEYALNPIKNRVGRQEPLDRFTFTGDMIEALRNQLSAVGDIRRAAARDLRRDHSLEEIASMTGLTRSRIKQIVDGK